MTLHGSKEHTVSSWLRSYQPPWLRADLIAGVVSLRD